MMPGYGRNLRRKAIIPILMFAAVSCLPLLAQSSPEEMKGYVEVLPSVKSKFWKIDPTVGYAVKNVGGGVYVISDNGCYGTITQHHDIRYPGRPYLAATQLTNPDFALWATAFGAKGYTIRQESEVEDTIAAALSVKHQPVVVHVHSSLEQISAWRRRS